MSRRVRLAAALGCALCAFVLCLVYARSVRADADRAKRAALEAYGGDVVRVAVATQQLEPSEKVTESDVEMRDFLVDLVPEGAVTRLEDAMGKTITSPVSKGAVLSALCFREAGSSFSVPSGRVAVTVTLTDKTGVPSDIEAGASLVAYASVDKDSRLISADVQVLAVRQKDSMSSASTITLAVPPNDVADVLSASARESLRLVLPASDVTSIPSSKAATTPHSPLEAPASVPPVVQTPLERETPAEQGRDEQAEEPAER